MPKKLQRKVAVARPLTASTTSKPPSPGWSWRGQRVTPRILTEFTSQLAVLLDAGIPVAKALRILGGQLPPGGMQRTVKAVVDDVESGTSLSESMAKHPRVFDRLYTNMVHAGEAGGLQDEILARLAGFMEKSESIKQRVRAALMYPIAVLIVAVVVLVALFVFVIPQFKEIFASQFGGVQNMPTETRVLIAIGDHLKSWFWVYPLVLGLLYGLHRLLLAKVDGYRSGRDRLLLALPFFGSLISKSLVARFTRTFGTLIQSGVPHLDALEIVGGSVGNSQLVSAIDKIHGSIREGAGIAVPMGESGMFDDVVVNMIDVGEQTGELDRMLVKIADRYEADVDRTVDSAFRVIEVVLLVFIAVIVGAIILAVFKPLLKMMESLRR